MLAMLNERMKKITAVDMSLVKFSAFFFSIIVVKLFPALLNINYPLLIILVLACGAKPFYSFWLKK
jgi:hypothetical protein